jgi:hypothetical protein
MHPLVQRHRAPFAHRALFSGKPPDRKKPPPQVHPERPSGRRLFSTSIGFNLSLRFHPGCIKRDNNLTVTHSDLPIIRSQRLRAQRSGRRASGAKGNEISDPVELPLVLRAPKEGGEKGLDSSLNHIIILYYG